MPLKPPTNWGWFQWGTSLALAGVALYTLTRVCYRSNQKENEVRLLTQKELDSYFIRIGAEEKAIEICQTGPTLETLCEIHRLQTTHIHVSNYDMHDESKLHKKAPPISPFFNEIFNKLVIQKRHGYCFENNQLLRHVLLSLGFKVKFYNSHIIRNKIPKEDPQHVVMIVTLDNKDYLVDAGYGGVAPIPIAQVDVNKEQTGLGYPWLSHYYYIPNTMEASWKPLYLFNNKLKCTFEEFRAANEQVSNNDEKTPFKTTLFETAFIGDDTRIALTQNELLITKAGKITLWKPVKNEEKFKKYLGKYLGYSQQQLNQLGRVSKRVVFGNPTNPCLLWYETYKKQKNLVNNKEQGAEKSKLSFTPSKKSI